MKKKSLSLNALKVNSFVTNTRAIKGGNEDPTAPPSNSCYFSCFLDCPPQNEEIA